MPVALPRVRRATTLLKQKSFGIVVIRRALPNPLPTLARQLELVCRILYERNLKFCASLSDDGQLVRISCLLGSGLLVARKRERLTWMVEGLDLNKCFFALGCKTLGSLQGF